MTQKLSLTEALKAARETRFLELGENILERTPAIFEKCFPGCVPVLVADKYTYSIAGKTVAEAFRGAGKTCAKPFIFDDPNLYAEFKFVEQLENSLQTHQAIPVAIGSGTINDLAKLAAHRTNRPYMVVATAASMDGYTAFGASITFKGSKQTFSCPAPVAVIADVEIIRRAPTEMTASGYADLLAKITAGTDWILADALGVEPIEQTAWNIVQGGLREALSEPFEVRNGNSAAISKLTEGLMLGGFAMQWAKSSRPASGAEHQFSHLWDMQHHTHNGAAPSHGFKVGVATLAVASLYEQLLQLPLDQLDVNACCAAWPDEKFWMKRARDLLGEELAASVAQEIPAKHSSPEQLRAQLETLRKIWPDLRGKLREQLLPLEKIKKMLRDSGAPTEPEQIGITRQRLRESFSQAFCIRRRFTVLDLAIRCGVLDKCLDQIFGAKETC